MCLLDLYHGKGMLGGPLKLHVPFYGRFLLGSSKMKKWGDNQNKRFFINNSVEAVILFKNERQWACEIVVRLSMYDGPIELVGYIWVNMWIYISFPYSWSTIKECKKWDAVVTGGDKIQENTNQLQGLTFNCTM